MSKPIIANNKPAKVDLEAGKSYHFCICGRSANQPFCNGAHKTTDLTPRAFSTEKTGPALLCACKQSATLPYCDGSHKQFPADAIGKEA